MTDRNGSDRTTIRGRVPMRPAARRVPLRVPPARSVPLVAVGGALGALARVAVGVVVPAGQGGWPWPTMVANLSGALLLGLIMGVLDESLAGGVRARPLLATGIIGAFTTFSTLSLEIQQLAAHGRPVVAVGYAASSLAGGLLAVWTGSAVAVTALRRVRRGGR